MHGHAAERVVATGGDEGNGDRPFPHKTAATSAGLGWIGKHTNLLNRTAGSWFFLGEVFTTLKLAPEEAEADHCGACRRCLDVCPTAAFPAPYRLDARRCISYLTIEHKGHIAREFRSAMGNRIYGCDDCLAVCPWNKFAKPAGDADLSPRTELTAPLLADLVRLDDAAFRALFAGSAVKRLGRDRFIRNVLIALGNSADVAQVGTIRPLLEDGSPLVRAMAVWALSRLMAEDELQRLRGKHLSAESDETVREEWQLAAA